MKKIVETFHCLSELKIIHADIKPDNLLVQYNAQTRTITDLKLIDFGSAFAFDTPGHI